MPVRALSVWATLRKRDKVMADKHYHCSYDDILSGTLDDICKTFDISKPVILYKHEDDLKKFNRVVFRAGDFMDAFGFDMLEIEIVRDKKKEDNVIYIGGV